MVQAHHPDFRAADLKGKVRAAAPKGNDNRQHTARERADFAEAPDRG